MKLLLVVPPYRTTDALTAQLYPLPYGPVLLATELESSGHEVHLEDFLQPAGASKCEQPATFAGLHAPAYMHYGRPLEECFAWLNRHAPEYDAVGLALGQCNVWETGAKIAAMIKSLGLPLVVGGPFATTAPEEVQRITQADVVVTGLAEATVQRAFEVAISRRGQSFTIIDCEPVEMADLPVPNWRKFAPLAKYPAVQGKVRGVLSISRGCPWQCSFCSVHTIAGRKYRRHTTERISQELRNLVDAGAQYICFLDDNLFINEKAVDELLGLVAQLRLADKRFARVRFYVEEGLEIRLAAQPGIIKRIADAGFENIGLGLETMNEVVRQRVNKPYKPEELRQAVDECQAAGVPARAFYIIGFPEDTVASVCSDLVAFGKLGLAARPNNLKLYPGTAMTAQFMERGLVDERYDWRMSSWYTPASGGLDYPTIKQLKTVLGAIGHAAEQFGVALFADDAETIAAKMREARYLVTQEGEGVRIVGNMFRPTPYRHMAEMLLLRQGAAGAESVVEDKAVIARPLAAPKNPIQAALAPLVPALMDFSSTTVTLPVQQNGRCFNQDLMRGEHTVGTEGMQAVEQQGTSIFDPVLCELAYRWFCPVGGIVLDPFAGGSVRGVVASKLGRQYIGMELRAEQIAANREQADIMCNDPMPVWVEGDARNVRQLCADVQADFIFSCPPYFDLEVYSDDARDLSTMAYEEFLVAYRQIIAEFCAVLREDRFACFVVGDVRDERGLYRGLPYDTIGAFKAAGLALYNDAILVTSIGSLPIRVGHQFTSTRKMGKCHQNVLVFLKGDPRRATEAAGDAQFGSVEQAPGAEVLQ